MLLERARALTDHITQNRLVEQGVAEYKPFETRVSQLTKIRDEFALLRRQTEALCALGEAPALPVSHVETLRKRLTDNRDSLIETAEADEFRYKIRESATALRKEAQDILLECWQTLVKRVVPVVDDDSLRALRKLPAMRAGADRALRHATLIGEIRQTLPPDIETAYEELRAAAEGFETERAGLPLDDLPPSAHGFMRQAVTPEGAKIDSLTPDVLAWLMENGLLNSFRVRLA